MIYHCPDCGKRLEKSSFGYPVCCGSTMKQGSGPNRRRATDKTHDEIEMLVKDLDHHAGGNLVTDWELNFIADMADHTGSFTSGQFPHILRLWEKYCA